MCLKDSEKRGKERTTGLHVRSPELFGRIGEEKGNYYRRDKVARKHTSGFGLVLETGKRIPFPEEYEKEHELWNQAQSGTNWRHPFPHWTSLFSQLSLSFFICNIGGLIPTLLHYSRKILKITHGKYLAQWPLSLIYAQ